MMIPYLEIISTMKYLGFCTSKNFDLQLEVKEYADLFSSSLNTSEIYNINAVDIIGWWTEEETGIFYWLIRITVTFVCNTILVEY